MFNHILSLIRLHKVLFVGALLIAASVVCVYLSSQDFDLYRVYLNSTAVDSKTASKDFHDNSLVSITDTVFTNEKISDGLYLKPNNYISVERQVEMYSWKEETTTHRIVQADGSESLETTFHYRKVWTRVPQDSKSFNIPKGHENPRMTIQNTYSSANTARIGTYEFTSILTALPPTEKLALSSKTVMLNTEPKATIVDTYYLYRTRTYNGSYRKPAIGDLRISYNAVKSGFHGTLFGKINGATIERYNDGNRATIYQLFRNSRNDVIASYRNFISIKITMLRTMSFLFLILGSILILEARPRTTRNYSPLNLQQINFHI